MHLVCLEDEGMYVLYFKKNPKILYKIVKLDCLTPRKLLYKTLKSTNTSTNLSICIHGSSWVPITKIINSKVEYSYIVTINVSNIKKKLVYGFTMLCSEILNVVR